MASGICSLWNSTHKLKSELPFWDLGPTIRKRSCYEFGFGSYDETSGKLTSCCCRRSEGNIMLVPTKYHPSDIRLPHGIVITEEEEEEEEEKGKVKSCGLLCTRHVPIRHCMRTRSCEHPIVYIHHHFCKLRQHNDFGSLERRNSSHQEYSSSHICNDPKLKKVHAREDEGTIFNGKVRKDIAELSSCAKDSITIKVCDRLNISGKGKNISLQCVVLPGEEELNDLSEFEVGVVADATTKTSHMMDTLNNSEGITEQRDEVLCGLCKRVTDKSTLKIISLEAPDIKRFSLQDVVRRESASIERSSPNWNGVNYCDNQHCGYHICTPLTLTIHSDKTVNIQTSTCGHGSRRHSQDTNSSRDDDMCTGIGNRRNVANANFIQYIMNLITPSDNKLSMKLFGSRKAVMKEKQRQEDEGRLIIHPCSAFRLYWDIVMLCLLIANVILLPLAISFFHSGEQSRFWTAFNLFSDTIFILDIILNFRTGIILNNYVDEIILDPKQIARHYMRGWFIVDAMSSFPVDYIFFLLEKKRGGYQIARTGRAIKAIRLFRLLSLLRLLRVSRLVRYASQWEEFFSVAAIAMRIFNLIGLIVLIAHWNGCLQFLVPCIQDFPADSWVAVNNLQNATWTKQYTLALFKALSHMLSIGYGRFPPKSYTDMWLTMLSMIVGAIVYATTIGHVSALVQSFDTSGRQYNEKIRKVEEYMMWRKLPRQLRTQILDYYEHRYQGKMFDETLILSELSKTLYLDVVNHNCRTLVSSVPFFANAEQNFIDNIITKLEFEMFQPGDIIIAEGSFGDKMYFIQEGVVDIIKANGEFLTTLSDGSYFGEISLILKTRRTANVRAVTYCNLYSLSALNVEMILQQFPTVKRTFAVIAAERLSKLGMNIADCRLADKSLENDAKIVADLFKELEVDGHKEPEIDNLALPNEDQNKEFRSRRHTNNK